MNDMPEKIKRHIDENIENDGFYSQCCLSVIPGYKPICRPQMHHVWIYRRKQIQEVWAIVPVAGESHDHEYLYRPALVLMTLFRIGKSDREIIREKYPHLNIDIEIQRHKYGLAAMNDRLNSNNISKDITSDTIINYLKNFGEYNDA